MREALTVKVHSHPSLILANSDNWFSLPFPFLVYKQTATLIPSVYLHHKNGICTSDNEMDSLTVEAAIAFLHKKSTTTGDSVFSHLSRLIQLVLETKAEDAVDVLETSMLLKQTRLLSDDGIKSFQEGRNEDEEKVVQRFLNLFNVAVQSLPDPEGEAADQEETGDAESNCEVVDFLTESASLETVGVGLGRMETYLIVLALKQLGAKPGVLKARFFGKFFGTSGNYYIFETNKLEDDETENVTEINSALFGRPVDTIPPEKEGSNAHVYWACRKLGDTFIRLPDVTPLQIKTARSLKKFLTGNLDAEVSAYPPFPGLERNFLRAQIARISASTVLAPQGYFMAEEVEGDEEPSGKIEKTEEWTMPSPAELAKLEAWVHQYPHLKKQGRCSLYVPVVEPREDSDEDAEEETPKGEEEPEQSPDLLTSVKNDAEISEGMKPWSVSCSSSIKGLKHQVVCLQSLLWPGAYAVTTKDGFSNVYIGWGIKNSPYEPPSPPEVQKEYDEELVETQELPPIPEPENHKEPTESEVEPEEDEELEEEED